MHLHNMLITHTDKINKIFIFFQKETSKQKSNYLKHPQHFKIFLIFIILWNIFRYSSVCFYTCHFCAKYILRYKITYKYNVIIHIFYTNKHIQLYDDTVEYYVNSGKQKYNKFCEGLLNKQVRMLNWIQSNL